MCAQSVYVRPFSLHWEGPGNEATAVDSTVSAMSAEQYTTLAKGLVLQTILVLQWDHISPPLLSVFIGAKAHPLKL